MGYEFENYVDIYLKVGVQRFVDMGGGFAFSPVSKTFLDLEKAKNFISANEGIWETQDVDGSKIGLRKVDIHYIKYPEPIVVNECGKKEEELITEEHEWLGVKYTTKICCKEHAGLSAIVPEEVRDWYDFKYDEAKKVKH